MAPINGYRFWEIQCIKVSGGSYTFKFSIDGGLLYEDTYSGLSDAVMVPTNFYFGTTYNYASCVFGGWYILDSSPGEHVGPLGPVYFTAIKPTGDNVVEFTPSAGTDNFDCIDEHDDATSNVGALGAKDLLVMEDPIRLDGSIAAFSCRIRAKVNTAGARSMAPVLKLGGTEYQGVMQPLSTEYEEKIFRYVKSPATGHKFTYPELDNLIAGYKIQD